MKSVKKWQAYGNYILVEIFENVETKESDKGILYKDGQSQDCKDAEGRVLNTGTDMTGNVKPGDIVRFVLYEINTPRWREHDKLYGIIPEINIVAIKSTETKNLKNGGSK